MRLRFPAFVLAVLCAMTAFAESPKGPKGITVEKDIPYVVDGDPAQKLDLYIPDKPSEKPYPLVVNIHGGGWSGGSKAGLPQAFLLSQGYAAASVEYRFSQKALFPAQIQDCQAAIRWLRANAKKYNFDADHIGVIGGSAGGHLVALLGTAGGKKAFPTVGGNEDQSDRVQAVCDWFGPSDFCTVAEQAADDKNAKCIFHFDDLSSPYAKLIGGVLGQDKQKCEAVSPVHYVSKDNPPFLILHGTKDTLVPYAQSVELADDLRKAGVEVLLQPFPGSGHGGAAFGMKGPQKLMTAFFDKHLKGLDEKVELLPDDEVIAPPKKLEAAPAK